jgi:amidase
MSSARWAALLALFVAAASPLAQSQPRGAPAHFAVVEKSILDLQNAMDAGTVTSRDLVDAFLARVRAYDQNGPGINAFVGLNPRAREVAEGLDAERRARGSRGPLHGIPLVVKDNYATSDMPTTAASLALAGFETGRDAFQVRKLRDAGAVIIGKTNLHELAYGITTISSAGGQTRNPYDPRRNPGGSSGGTGAAIAANFAVAGLGSDTCGSIRNPAAHNNLFGLRPTLGLSSRDGIVPLSHSQDVGGPLARTVTDLAILLDATAGVDAADPATRAGEGNIPRSYLAALNDSSLRGVRIGLLMPLFGAAPEDQEVAGIVRRTLAALTEIGAETVEVQMPKLQDLLERSSLIDSEFKFDLIDFLGRYPNAPVRSLDDILAGGLYHNAIDAVLRRANAVQSRETDISREAHERRALVTRTIMASMEEQRFAAFAYPTLRRKPAVIGEPQRGSNCQLSATTGLPAISVPAGFTADGLPIGLDLLGRRFGEGALLKIAYAYEKAANPRREPPGLP